jgi:hypothetical protein
MALQLIIADGGGILGGFNLIQRRAPSSSRNRKTPYDVGHSGRGFMLVVVGSLPFDYTARRLLIPLVYDSMASRLKDG